MRRDKGLRVLLALSPFDMAAGAACGPTWAATPAFPEDLKVMGGYNVTIFNSCDAGGGVHALVASYCAIRLVVWLVWSHQLGRVASPFCLTI